MITILGIKVSYETLANMLFLTTATQEAVRRIAAAPKTSEQPLTSPPLSPKKQ
jgi:hypothetical protein